MKKRIGIVSIWFRRGQTYVALQVKSALEKNGFEVFTLGRKGGIGGNYPMEDTRDELSIGNFTTTKDYAVDAETFSRWGKDNSLDGVVFIEEQWQRSPNLGALCKLLGIPSFNIIMWEFFNPDDREFYQEFDRLIFPIRCGYDKAISHGYADSEYVPWGIDFSLWDRESIGGIDRGTDESVRFFHSSGWGGIYGRKQTQLIVEAFLGIEKDINAKLLIHRQSLDRSGVVTKEKISDKVLVLTGDISVDGLKRMYAFSDFSINVSKWEGLGLNFLESAAMGVPVISVAAQPMSEWAKAIGSDGLICSLEKETFYPGICVGGAEVSVNSLQGKIIDASKMKRGHINAWKEATLVCAKEKLDWAENGNRLSDVVKELV